MATPEPAELKKARSESGKVMLAIEAAALTRLRSTVQQTIARTSGTSTATIVETSHRIEDAVAADVLLARTAARRESRRSFDAEMVAAVGNPAGVTVDMRAKDTAAAAQVGKSYSAAWLAQAIAADAAGGRSAMQRAANDTDYKIKAIAASEVSAPFSDEREVIGAEYARRSKSRLAVIPLKLWWARLDRVCPRCRDLNGTVRLFGVNFPGGAVPGGVHTNCRCYESVTVIGFTVDVDEEDS